eukprot:scaffold8437_cov77-Skeletonema_dohrnii-CCMP3373.AAC.1
MGPYKLWVAIVAALDTIWCGLVPVTIPTWASSGHLRRSRDVDSHIKSLSSGIYPSILSYPL